MRTTMIHTSDLHGEFPKIPKCDILTISGDICPNKSRDMNTELIYQGAWLRQRFAPWLKSLDVGITIATWGNHDWIGYHEEGYWDLHVPVFWLVDRMFTHRESGLRFYGTPWTLTFLNWAFMLDEERLALKFANIPECDVLLSHGPPYGYGDKAPPIPELGKFDHERVGSPSLLKRIEEVRPQLTVFGHIHPCKGLYRHNDLPLANVTVVDRHYLPLNPLLKSTWENGKLVDMEPVSPCTS